MKNNIKNILILTAVALTMNTANVQAACYNKTCAEMGYVKALNQCDPAQGMLKCPFDLNLYYCFEKPCKVGDIYYSDKTCSADIISGKTPIGVVGYVENGGTNGLVLALDETQSTWSNENYDIPCIENVAWNSGQDGTAQSAAQQAMRGKENTACIVQTKNSRNASYSAGMYCANYTYSGVGGWFLPASGEAYKTLFLGKGRVNATLGKLSKTKLDTNGNWYWSSTEYQYGYNSRSIWALRLQDGSLSVGSTTGDNKTFTTYRVRCVLSF